MTLESENIDRANQLAAQFYGEYNINFIKKDEIVLLNIVSKNGGFFMPASTETIEIMQKQMNKVWGQLNTTSPIKSAIKQPEKIKIKPKKEAIELNYTQAKNYYKNYYLYKGQKYFFIN